MDIIAPKVIAALVLPPGGNLVLAALGLVLLARGGRRFGGFLLFLAFASLLVASMPIVSVPYAGQVESYPAISVEAIPRDQIGAIVVLGGGRYPHAPEYGGEDTVSRSSLVRVRYAAWLHHRTGLPILVSGGSVHGEPVSEGAVMAKVLADELAAPVRWIEDRSRNTAENARYSAEMLRREGVEAILLVTHAAHMARAVARFEFEGLLVYPAPTGFTSHLDEGTSVFDYLPSTSGLHATRTMLHERLGRLWYWLRYR